MMTEVKFIDEEVAFIEDGFFQPLNVIQRNLFRALDETERNAVMGLYDRSNYSGSLGEMAAQAYRRGEAYAASIPAETYEAASLALFKERLDERDCEVSFFEVEMYGWQKYVAGWGLVQSPNGRRVYVKKWIADEMRKDIELRRQDKADEAAHRREVEAAMLGRQKRNGR